MTPASGDKGASAEPATAPSPASEQAPAAFSDEQIFKVIDLANTSEIEQAKVAQTKAKNGKVKTFAAMMVSHHGEAKAKGAKLSTKLGLQPAESEAASQLKTDSEQIMIALKQSSAADFDITYMTSQVEAHEKVLATLDGKLIPAAKDPELKILLQEMRSTVRMHLDTAQQSLAELSSAPRNP